ncbi:hypothetical protein OAT58_00285 [Flavobacteriaceae bacterium]|jgi:hypothetical protein|nr:hypothetical protein [Flavobacteriaceae bacterium]MDC3198467.1 hypothetical protein [Flavobacteriaceae bacterium]
MKKLLLLSALLIFACGGDDDNNNDSSSFSLVGTWAGTVTDSEDNSEGQVELMFNSDSTGAINIDWSQGQEEDVFGDTFTWTSDDSQININYSDPDNGSEILYYSFVNQNTVEIYADGDAESTTLTRQ